MSDVSVTAGSVIASANAVIETVVAGETLTAGQPVYINSSGLAMKADANGSSTWSVRGIVLNGASVNQSTRIALEDSDFTPGFTLSLSGAADDGVYVLSATAGGIAPVTDLASGHYPVVLMVAKSTTKAYLKIVGGRSDATALGA
jgi:hypothetical protein